MFQSILISACLLGIKSSYNGLLSKQLLDHQWLTNKSVCFIPFCPEQLTGFSTPRPPVEIIGGDGADVLADRAKVITEKGTEVTDQFLAGLDDIKKIAEWTRPNLVVTQSRSPSCSCVGIYDGTFSHQLISGFGVYAAFLKQEGYQLIDISHFNKKGHTLLK
ncbi:protein containing DUF523 [Candidatus Magnetomorum sp. HK-1]|nr:protein containing DUF523 [Candidatus Magnetomorum sp. HK-1]